MKQVVLFFRLLLVFIRVISGLIKQFFFIKKELKPVLDYASLNNDGSLNERDFKKITKYYGVASGFLGEAFCTLHGRGITVSERKLNTYKGALTGLFDDFFDLNQYSDDEIYEFLMNSKPILPITSAQTLFFYFIAEIERTLKDGESLKKYAEKVFESQQKSRRQLDVNITQEELIQITMAKGGDSLLFYRAGISKELDVLETEMFYQLGGLMQLSNDIFDVYKDQLEGVTTLATSCVRIGELRDFYQSQVDIWLRQISELKIEKSNVKTFLELISFGLICRTYVCLDYFESSEKESDGVFTPKKYDRVQLICDMEKPINVLRSVKFHLKLMSEFEKGNFT